jgi:hypothetical protein
MPVDNSASPAKLDGGRKDDPPVRPLAAEAARPSMPAPAASTTPDVTGHWPRVTVLDGVYNLQFSHDRIVPFLQNGEPLRNLGVGWNFHSLFTGFAPVLLFELEHDNGHRATWFFDSVPKFLGHTVDGLTQHYRDILISKATGFIEVLLSPLLAQSAKIPDDSLTSFFAISEIARQQLAEACLNALLPPPEYLLLSDFPETLMSLPKGASEPPTVISRANLATAIQEDFQTRLIKALNDGYLSWPSIVDQADLTVSGSLCFNHFSYAYRVEEPEAGLVYFLLASEHHARLLGLYIPSEGLVISGDAWSRQSLVAIMPAVHTTFLTYFCQFGDTLVRSFGRPGRKRVAVSMRESHLGHQLWNEFSGLEAIIRNVPRQDLPQITSLGGRAHGCFGPLDKIFPEFRGKIRDELQSEREIYEYANNNDVILARFTGLFVSKEMRDRIIGYMQQTNDFRAAIESRNHHAGPVIMIGLRVENRTVVDQTTFLKNLIRHIATVIPGCTIVLDGQNRRDDTEPVGSFSDKIAIRSPLDVEAELCEAAMASAVGQNVTVVTTTGNTIASSIGWAYAADCFIAIWGAGLAKYRWICNKKGLVLSSKYHLLNPAEMSIYHTTTTMENPASLVYADPACVEDDPAATQLIPVDGPRHVSFRVDETLFFPQVTAFLRECLGGLP